jgi:hypothetical protein
MVGGLDAAAVLLLERATSASGRYLGLSPAALFDRIEADFPPDRRMIGHNEAHFRYEDLPDFAFTVMPRTGIPAVTVFGRSGFEGFVLTLDETDQAVVDVEPTAAADARGLAEALIQASRVVRKPGLAAAYSIR